MAEMKPHVPPIPPDAKRAQHHAPPTNLDNPPAAPTPAQAATGGDDGMQEVPIDSSQDYGPEMPYSAIHKYESPEPVEAMFAQLRADQKKMETMLLLTNTIILLSALLALYALKKGGVVDA